MRFPHLKRPQSSIQEILERKILQSTWIMDHATSLEIKKREGERLEELIEAYEKSQIK